MGVALGALAAAAVPLIAGLFAGGDGGNHRSDVEAYTKMIEKFKNDKEEVEKQLRAMAQGNANLQAEGKKLQENLSALQEKIDEQERKKQEAEEYRRNYPVPDWMRNMAGWFDRINILVVGESHVGKSTLIASMMGAEEGDTRDIFPRISDQVEGTLEPTPYTFDHMDNIFQNQVRVIDMPGYGTPNNPTEGYVQRCGVKHADSMFIVTEGRVREADVTLVMEAMRAEIPVFYIRNKIQITMDRAARIARRRTSPYQGEFSETDELERIRQQIHADARRYFPDMPVDKIYILDSFYHNLHKFDTQRLFTDVAQAVVTVTRPINSWNQSN